MELADSGDMLAKIQTCSKKGINIPEVEIWSYFVQLIRGLGALHDLKIVHRDIKCANLFLSSGGILKLGDLNVSKVAKTAMLKT